MKDLQPQIVWNHFYEITQIPRPSKKEEKILGPRIDMAVSIIKSFVLAGATQTMSDFNNK